MGKTVVNRGQISNYDLVYLHDSNGIATNDVQDFVKDSACRFYLSEGDRTVTINQITEGVPVHILFYNVGNTTEVTLIASSGINVIGSNVITVPAAVGKSPGYAAIHYILRYDVLAIYSV